MLLEANWLLWGILSVMAIYQQLLDWHCGTKSRWSPSSFNPTVQRESQFVLVAPVFEDATIRVYGRGVEALFHIFPINDFIAPSRNHNDSLDVPVPSDGSDVWLNGPLLEGGELLRVAER
jgi:hypothetical protein